MAVVIGGGGSSGFPADNVFGPPGEPGLINPAAGYKVMDSDGTDGFDTHSFFFNYKAGVSDKTVASYDIFADPGNHGNTSDFLTGYQNGRYFTLGPGELSAAHVSASLVPLPPAAVAGAATLAGLGLLSLARRRMARA